MCSVHVQYGTTLQPVRMCMAELPINTTHYTLHEADGFLRDRCNTTANHYGNQTNSDRRNLSGISFGQRKAL